jgi:hypothetical protein
MIIDDDVFNKKKLSYDFSKKNQEKKQTYPTYQTDEFYRSNIIYYLIINLYIRFNRKYR